MEVLDNVGGLFPLVVSKLNLLQELVGHSLQSIIWPGLAEGNKSCHYMNMMITVISFIFMGIKFVDFVEIIISRVRKFKKRLNELFFFLMLKSTMKICVQQIMI